MICAAMRYTGWVVLLAAAPAAAAPRVLYTDLLSGPNSGGEGDDGTLLGIFGTGFGSDLGQVTVFIGAGEAARYVYLGPSLGRPDVQQLAVQIGAAATTGAVRVVVGGVESNSDHTFTVRAGSIYYVAVTGDDASSGSFASPWGTLAAAKSKLSAGDILYAMDGVSQTVNDPLGSNDAALRISTSRGAAVAGVVDQPIALVAYPGAQVTVGCTAAGCPNHALRVYLPYWTLAGLRVIGGSASFNSAVDINDYLMPPDGARLVNNDITSGYYGVSANSSHIRILGNRAHDMPHSAFYYGGGHAAEDIEVAWNRIDHLAVGSGNGIYGVKFYYAYSVGTVPAAERRVTDIVVRNNFIHDISGAGILIGGADWGGWAWLDKVTVSGNIVVAAGRSNEGGIRIGDVGQGETEMDVTIANNTLYGNSRGLELAAVQTAVIRNNLIVQTNAGAYFTGSSSVGLFTIDHNLYSGGSSLPAEDTAPLTGDPLFVDAAGRDFHLLGTSPAIDAGAAVAESAALVDHDGADRPQGTAFDVGAYEFVPTCNVDGDCAVAPPCRLTAGALCTSGTCLYAPAASGAACDDGDACTAGDACDGAGHCVSGADSCPVCDDADGDGYGSPASSACAHAELDCDDAASPVHPGAVESCNGIDDDCNGATDDNCLACTDGASRACYDGRVGTDGVGVCAAGSQSCAAGVWGACSGQVLPSTESCGDGLDNDCDGSADSGCGAGSGGGSGGDAGAVSGGCNCRGGGAAPLALLALALLTLVRRSAR